MKTIVPPSEGPKAGVQSVVNRSARVVPGQGAPGAPPPRAVKLLAAEVDQDLVVTVDTIHARAETVTTVLESILHCQPVLPPTMR